MKKKLIKIHKWLGFSVGLFFVLSGITGSLLVYKTELEQLLNKDLFTVNSIAEQEVSFKEMYSNVLQAFPSNDVLFIKNVRPQNATVEFWLEGDRIAQVNPYTGEVQGSRHELDTFLGWIADFHIHLLSGETGELIVGALGFICSFLVCSGLFLWGPGVKKHKSRLSWYRGKNKIRWYFQNHKVFGVLTSPFMLFSALTGGLIVFYPFIAGLVIFLKKTDLGSLQAMAEVPTYEKQKILSLDELIVAGQKDL
ncbi:MAG: PepSY domain-containing protein [Lentisphaerales bacterium]|nr:PepSY domain-containing protein [Lentisphaerales bacterium]